MIDRDLADLYQITTKRLNEQVKRNIGRFPKEFRFQLSDKEKDELVANCDRLKRLKHSSANPYVFTEQGIAMLSSVLHSDVAVKISIEIIKTFVRMRRFLIENAGIFQRLESIERKQIDTDKNLRKIFEALEDKNLKTKQGIFYNGQIFDSYVFVADLVKKAKTSIILLDNYIDESVLQIFSKRKKGVGVIIYTKKITNSLKLDIKKFNEQYEAIVIKEFLDSHDRFLIIDNKEVYHFGASLKDLGKKWFGFSKMDIGIADVIEKLREVGDE